MKRTLLILAWTAGLAAGLAGQGLRAPVFADQFYPGDAATLSADLDAYFAAAASTAAPAGKVIGLIAPHAGYLYSGRTAASAYALLRGRPVETVVVIGPSHRAPISGCSIWPGGGFETPLGVARVDARLAGELSKASGFGFEPEAFSEEHSVEVQIPFIQKAAPQAAIVPVVMGRPTRATIRTLAEALEKTCLGKNVVVVASTDLSHYLPKAEAQATDARTAALIQKMDTAELVREVEAGENIMCGGGGVAALLLLAKKAGQPRVAILGRTDSSAFGGPVVGYLAAAVLAGEAAESPVFTLTREEKTELLRLARRAVATFLEDGRVLEDRPENEKFLAPHGVFVTLKKGPDLRGCIGYIEPVMPLGRAVIETAVLAATEDPRFPPVERRELDRLSFEISVLTPPREVSNPKKVTVGRHGLVVSQAGRKGVLLPQVPVENAWDRETFLEQACLKAGLPPNAWRHGAKLAVFEAIVFHE